MVIFSSSDLGHRSLHQPTQISWKRNQLQGLSELVDDGLRDRGYEELAKRDKANLDIFWLKDGALEESANLIVPGIIAQEIMIDLEAALEQFAAIAEDLKVAMSLRRSRTRKTGGSIPGSAPSGPGI